MNRLNHRSTFTFLWAGLLCWTLACLSTASARAANKKVPRGAEPVQELGNGQNHVGVLRGINGTTKSGNANNNGNNNNTPNGGASNNNNNNGGGNNNNNNNNGGTGTNNNNNNNGGTGTNNNNNNNGNGNTNNNNTNTNTATGGNASVTNIIKGGGGGGGVIAVPVFAGGAGDAGPGVAAGPAVDAIAVKVVNPAATNTTLSYSIDGQSFSLPSGSAQAYSVSADGVIEFGRGNDFGTARYSLSPGTYTFESTSHGWELFHGAGGLVTPAVDVRIVNPAATQFTLAFTIDGVLYRLGPGKTQEINVGSNSTIEFGRGQDLGFANYPLHAGTYTFKSTPKGWDVDQPPEDVAGRPATPSSSTK